MELNIREIKKLIKEYFRGNISWFAEEIGCSRAWVSEALNGGNNNKSSKICKGVIKFCNNNGLDYKNYIFLPWFVKKNWQRKRVNRKWAKSFK